MRNPRLFATVAVSGTVLAGLLAPATADAATATCGTLPTWVQGRPAGVHAQAPAGDYLWHDAYGWHLRVTHRGTARMVFTGVITASEPMRVRLVKDERREAVALSADRARLTFHLVNYGAIDGFDLADGCASTMRVGLVVNRLRTPLSRIVVGAHSAHPGGNPFVIERSSSPLGDAPTTG